VTKVDIIIPQEAFICSKSGYEVFIGGSFTGPWWWMFLVETLHFGL
jgi:hexokinase